MRWYNHTPVKKITLFPRSSALCNWHRIKVTVKPCYQLFTELALLAHLSCLNRCPSNKTSIFAARYHSPHTTERSMRRAVSPYCSLQGDVQINSLSSQSAPSALKISCSDQLENHNWAQDTFRSPAQWVVMSIPSALLSEEWTQDQIIPDTLPSQLAMPISHRGIQNVKS